MTYTVINASAGSGKTHTLTHEIAARIGRGLQPSQIIATTFTTKAAAELSDRVRRTLLDLGNTGAATAVDSALIGTVNSVAGQLLREFALDAGISPDVQVLDQDRQQAAFSAAIDDAAAAAGTAATDLLARTGHDGEENPAFAFSAAPSWRRHVGELAARARTNRIDADRLAAAAADSWEEYRTTALPKPGEDRRSNWLRVLDEALDDLRAQAAAAKPSAAKTIRNHLEKLDRLHRDLGDLDRAPWAGWVKIAAVAQVDREREQAREIGEKPRAYAYAKAVDATLLDLAIDIDEHLLANPVLQADVRALIDLVMHTAADSLAAYARYKDELGLIDFIDQEVRALELLRTSERARQVIRSRFHLLAVDEFQDTSPVQLELFLELGQLVEDTIWVGDPKQAIYGFRDADPALMLEILRLLEDGTTALGTGVIRDLSHSWRSQEPVLDLVNAIFPRIFPDLPLERVQLSAAPSAVEQRRREERRPGRVEAWIPEYSGRASAGRHACAVADGIMRLLTESDVTPSEIAVLVRTNSRAAMVVEALTERGVPTSGEGRPVLATREGRIVRAALAIALDRSDTLALTELVDLLAEHRAHGSWFRELTAAADAEERRDVFERWWQDPSFERLRALRADCIELTPVEMVSALIDALDLTELIRTWSVPDQRLRTLDAIRALAAEYADQARMDSRPITLTGFRAVLDESAVGPDLGGTPDTVWVGTLHGAKGLEWSHVVVMLEDSADEKLYTAGSFIVPAPRLDVTAPLAGRTPRYWPDFLGRFATLQDALADSDHARRHRGDARDEAGRLQYVALTRSADVTVLSGPGHAPTLDALVESARPLVSWDAGHDQLQVDGRDLPATIRTTCGEPDDDAELYDSARTRLAATDLPAAGTAAGGPVDGPAAGSPAIAARVQASRTASTDDLGTVGAPQRIGPRIVERGAADWDRVGEAVHAYLALPHDLLTPEQRESAAQRLVDRWAVGHAIEADVLVRAGTAWSEYLGDRYPGAEQLTEQPITWWNEDEQVMEGWIDALLRCPDGRIVLVDHKTYPGDDPVGHVRRHYLGQLDTYSRALTHAGAPPSGVLIHLPLRGEVLEVDLAATRPV